jgi:hypothetical protein
MNFITGEKLASTQQLIMDRIKKGEKIEEEEILLLEENAWVKAADILAPCNLVIRQYCLIDILRGESKHKIAIDTQLNALAPKGLYLEGYSYWLYTKEFLTVYLSKFLAESIERCIKEVDSNFVKTSYSVDDIKYPAPFGDLRHQPLEDALQNGNHPISAIKVSVVTKNNTNYEIDPYFIGFNLHTTTERKTYFVTDGKVIDAITGKEYVWYPGYKNKYPTMISELKAMFNLKRLKNFFSNI